MALSSTSPSQERSGELEQRNIAALQQMLTAFNTRNAPGMLAVFNEDMEWLDVPMERSYRGHPEVEAFLENLFVAFPDVTYELTDVVAEGEKLAAKFTMHATHLGPFYGIPATGRRIELPCLSIIEMRDAKFVYDHCYFDSGQCLRQMGLFPPIEMIETPVGKASFWVMVNRRPILRAAGSALAGLFVLKAVRRVLR